VVDSTSNRNEYQEYFLEAKDGRCVGLITQPPSFDDCLEIWEPEPPGTLRACSGLLRGLLYLCCFLSTVGTAKNLSILDVKLVVTGSLSPTRLQMRRIILWKLVAL
jgi:hypothetical protein